MPFILFLEMSAYVDFSSSGESENKVAVPKRRRNDDSESGSDVGYLPLSTNPSLILFSPPVVQSLGQFGF